MTLVKIRNVSKTIIFVDSISLSIRPYKTINDVVLIGEDQANNDPQLAKCLITGVLEKCPLNENFEKVTKKELDKPKIEKSEKVVKISKPDNKISTKADEKKNTKKNKKSAKNKSDEFVKSPDNTKSLVFAGVKENGDVIMREVNTIIQAEAPLPEFINERDVVNLTTENIDAENRGEPDIIYVDMK